MTTEPDPGARHAHGRSCYWDHLRCGWVCRPAPDPGPAAVAARERELVGH
jgi:hypothetical protein